MTALRLQAGMEALQEIAKEMDANLESMPDPTAKVVLKAMNVNRMATNLKRMSTKNLSLGAEGEREELS